MLQKYSINFAFCSLNSIFAPKENNMGVTFDDVTTNGSTLNEVLCTLRNLNEDNEITIFSLQKNA